MVNGGDELEEVDDVDEPDLELREEFAEEGSCSQSFECGNITTRCHDDVRIFALIVASPVPDTETFGAVLDSLVHVEKLEMVLLVCDDDVDVIDAAETMVGDG